MTPPKLPLARDLDLLDAVDACARSAFRGSVWRACVAGRDPLIGASSDSRWCNRSFDILYTSTERDGAVAEVHAYLDLQPVFPSKLAVHGHQLALETGELLHISDDAALARLGVEPVSYRSRRYERTQAVADAAFFLGFRGLIAPSARWPCQNVMLLTDRLDPTDLTVQSSEAAPVDWAAWRQRHRS